MKLEVLGDLLLPKSLVLSSRFVLITSHWKYLFTSLASLSREREEIIHISVYMVSAKSSLCIRLVGQHGVKLTNSRNNCLGSNASSTNSNCGNWGNLLNLSRIRFPHLKQG